MKRYGIVALLLVIAQLLAGTAFASGNTQFKHEYEIMNGQPTMDGQHTYAELTVPEALSVVTLDAAGALETLKAGTGILYMGFPECPWCRAMLPVLFDAMDGSGYDGSFYYYNGLADRDMLVLTEGGEIEIEEPGTDDYHALLAHLGDFVSEYAGLNDPSIRRIYFPTLIFFKDGEVLASHIDTVPGHDDGYVPLTAEQTELLLGQLKENIGQVQ